MDSFGKNIFIISGKFAVRYEELTKLMSNPVIINSEAKMTESFQKAYLDLYIIAKDELNIK